MELIQFPWPWRVGQQHEYVEKAERNLEMHAGLTDVLHRELAGKKFRQH